MSLLQAVQDATDLIGLPRPSSVIGNNDDTVRSLLAMANQGGQNLARMRDAWGGGWAILEKEHEFTTTDGIDAYDLPADFFTLVSDTVWDRTAYWQARGPLSPQEWQKSRSGLAESVALRLRYRIKRGSGASKQFFIDPIPSSAEDVVFEYLTDRWVTDSGGSVFTERFAADDDCSLLGDDLLTMDIIWRYKKTKSLGFAAELAEFEIERDKRFGADGGITVVPIARRGYRLPPGNVPNTGFGQ